MSNKQWNPKTDKRIELARREAIRFIEKVEAYKSSGTAGEMSSRPRAAVRRAALDCGLAMSQVNKSEHE